MTLLVSIAGLLLLVFVHELGHFLTALAVRMRPRRFYVGFPPPLARTRRNGVEYGVGVIPLGGYVKIPGMFRPAAGDLDRWFRRAEEEQPSLGGRLERVARSLEASDFDSARAQVEELDGAVGDADLGELARRQAEKGVSELRDALAPDAYWRQRAWKRIAVIFAGPGTNILLAIVLFAGLYMVGTGAYRLGFVLKARGQAATAVVDSVLRGESAARAGLRAGDRIVAIDRRPVAASQIPVTIRASHGQPVVLTVLRQGRRVVLPPARAQRDRGESPPVAFWSSLRLTGSVTKDIAVSLGQLVHGQGRRNISSPVGTVRVSEQALQHGVQDYLWVLGLISLSLALLNLLPLLPLDGGHIAFSIIEGIRGRAVARAVYERVSAVGIAIVLLLVVVGLSNDIGGRPGG